MDFSINPYSQNPISNAYDYKFGKETQNDEEEFLIHDYQDDIETEDMSEGDFITGLEVLEEAWGEQL